MKLTAFDLETQYARLESMESMLEKALVAAEQAREVCIGDLERLGDAFVDGLKKEIESCRVHKQTTMALYRKVVKEGE